ARSATPTRTWETRAERVVEAATLRPDAARRHWPLVGQRRRRHIRSGRPEGAALHALSARAARTWIWNRSDYPTARPTTTASRSTRPTWARSSTRRNTAQHRARCDLARLDGAIGLRGRSRRGGGPAERSRR